METKPKRPLSVWIAQFLLIVFTLIFTASLVTGVMGLIGSGSAPNLGFLLVVALNIGIVIALLAGFWGMVQRRSYGRWTGVIMLALMFVLSVLAQILQPEGPLQRYEYKNSTERWSGGFAQVMFGGLFLFLILHLAFAKKVTDFFTPPAEPPKSIPPPPPSFDEEQTNGN